MVAITKTEKYKDTLSYISLLHDDAFKLINQAMDLGGSVQCELDNLPPPSGFLPSCSVCVFPLNQRCQNGSKSSRLQQVSFAMYRSLRFSVNLLFVNYLGHLKPAKALFWVPKNQVFEGENLCFSWFWVPLGEIFTNALEFLLDISWALTR